MKHKRIPIEHDGRCPVDGYAIMGEWDIEPIDAVIRSIERRTGKRCYTRRQAGWNDYTKHYDCTFTNKTRSYGGGYAIAFEATIYIERH